MSDSVCIEPSPSLARRPVKRSAGAVAESADEYASAMLPAPSIAVLPIQRLSASGANVDCCATPHVPVTFRSSYHRGARPDDWLSTLRFVTSVSYDPKLRYWRRFMRRASASPSSVCPVPGCDTVRCVFELFAAMLRFCTFVNVELAVV